MTIQELLIELSDLIDMHDYEEDWEAKAQTLIDQIAAMLKEGK